MSDNQPDPKFYQSDKVRFKSKGDDSYSVIITGWRYFDELGEWVYCTADGGIARESELYSDNE